MRRRESEERRIQALFARSEPSPITASEWTARIRQSKYPMGDGRAPWEVLAHTSLAETHTGAEKCSKKRVDTQRSESVCKNRCARVVVWRGG